MNLRAKFKTARGPAATLADQGMVSLANFLTIFLFARSLDPEAFGMVALVLASAQMLMALQTSMIGQVHNVIGPGRDASRLSSLTGSLTVSLLVLSSGVGLVVIGVGAIGTVTAPGTAIGSICIAMAALMTPWMIQDGVRRMLYTDRHTVGIVASDVVCYGSMLAGSVAMAGGAIPATFHTSMAVLSVSAAAGAAVGLAMIRRSGARFIAASWREDARESWKLARYLVSGEALRALQGNVTTWIVAGAAGLPALGAYRAAVQLVNVLNPLQHAAGLYLPSAASARWNEGESGYTSWFRKRAAVVLLPFGVIAIGLAVLADPLVDLAYGGRYDGFPVAWLLAVSAIGRFFLAARGITHMGLVASGKPRIVVIDSILEGVMLAAIGTPLILRFGVQGAAAWHAFAGITLAAYAVARFRASAGSTDRGPAAEYDLPDPSGNDQGRFSAGAIGRFPTQAGVEEKICSEGLMPASVCIVVVTYSGREYLDPCLTSLLSTSHPVFRLVLVDNGSTYGAAAHVRARYPSVEIVELAQNAGYTGGANAGLRYALETGAEIVGILNDDTEICDPRWLSAGIHALECDRTLGTVGFAMADPGDDIARPVSVACVPRKFLNGFALLYRAETLRKIGLYDEEYFVYYDETDLQARLMRAGYTLGEVSIPVIHLGSGTNGVSPTSTYLEMRNGIRFSLKHRSIFRTIAKIVRIAEIACNPQSLFALPGNEGDTRLKGVGGRRRTLGLLLRAILWNIRRYPETRRIARQEYRRHTREQALRRDRPGRELPRERAPSYKSDTPFHD